MEFHSSEVGSHPVEDTPSYILASMFPAPDRNNTFAMPLTDEEVNIVMERGKFANWEARVASGALSYLRVLKAPTTADWEGLYDLIIDERADLKLLWQDREVARSSRNIQTPITDDSPNQDRVGDAGRFRVGADWDEAKQMWLKGERTPAGEALIEAGERAMSRFAAEGETGDTLQNKVRLPDGQETLGNKIVRGETARKRLEKMRDDIISRGIDVGNFETGGDIVLLVSAAEADRAVIFRAVMRELVHLAQREEQCTRQEFLNLVYLLFQSPKNKRGSDSVIRVFAAAASAYLTGSVIVLPRDVDLRAATLAQPDFT